MNNIRQDTNHKRSFLKQEEYEQCCSEDKKSARGEKDSPKECLERWRDSLADAHEKMKLAQACYIQAQKTHTQADAWKQALKTWKEEAEDAHEKALAIYQELDQFIKAMERTKTTDTVRAVEAVLCLVKSIFDDVDDLLYSSKSQSKVDDLNKGRAQLYWLKQSINCKDSLDAAKKKKALDCVEAFEKQITLIRDEKDALLTKLLQILHKANMLVGAVNKPVKPDDPEEAGIHVQLKDLSRRISGQKPDSNIQQKQACRMSLSTPESPCQSKTVVDTPEPPEPPGHLFPIQEMTIKTAEGTQKACGSPYYQEISEQSKLAGDAAKHAKELLEENYNAYKQAQAYHNGLSEAIQASENAKPSK